MERTAGESNHLLNGETICSTKNLQEFCRACLRKLSEWSRLSDVTTTKTTTTLSMKFVYNLESLPQIMKLLQIFASFEVVYNDDTEGCYPKSLCQPCYEKFVDIQEFRRMIADSTDKLNAIIANKTFRSLDEKYYKETTMKLESTGSSAYEKRVASDYINSVINSNIGDNEDRSSVYNISHQAHATMTTSGGNIKMDMYLEENEDKNLKAMKPNQGDRNISNETIKIEIDSEYDEDEMNVTNYYEQNALNNEAITKTGDEADFADDEEQSLRSGVANTSSDLLNPASYHCAKNLVRKRDRKKKSLKCPRCDKQVYKQVYLDAHIRKIHEGYEKPFLCSECQKSFTRYNQLHIHVQSNHMVKVKYVCDFDDCKATFKLSQTLETHRKVVHTDNPFSVEVRETLELHEKQLSRELELDHYCQQCNKKYSSKRALNVHQKRHSGERRDHVCNVCGAAKVTRTELSTHMRVHQINPEKFKCDLCPQQFNHKNAISRHIRIVHEGKRAYSCGFCSRKFGTRNAQTLHERLHKNEKPFKCDDCSKCFTQVQGLKSHMKNHNMSLRKYGCSYCEKRFITRKNLEYHEERHRGNQQHFVCDFCDQAFFRFDELTKHEHQVHRNINECHIEEGLLVTMPNAKSE